MSSVAIAQGLVSVERPQYRSIHSLPGALWQKSQTKWPAAQHALEAYGLPQIPQANVCAEGKYSRAAPQSRQPVAGFGAGIGIRVVSVTWSTNGMRKQRRDTSLLQATAGAGETQGIASLSPIS
jgi:hypothetical protein